MADRSQLTPAANIDTTGLRLTADGLGRRFAAAAPRLLIPLALTIVAAGQLAEDLSDSEPLQLLSPASALRRWAVIAAVLYMVAIARFVDGVVGRSLRALDDVVEIDPDRFSHYARR